MNENERNRVETMEERTFTTFGILQVFLALLNKLAKLFPLR